MIFAVVRCPSMSPYVCPCTYQMAEAIVKFLSRPRSSGPNSKGTPSNRGAKYTGWEKFAISTEISVYLGNDTHAIQFRRLIEEVNRRRVVELKTIWFIWSSTPQHVFYSPVGGNVRCFLLSFRRRLPTNSSSRRRCLLPSSATVDD